MRWTRFFRRRYWDEERARELEAYLQIETDENIARGMSPEEARYGAQRKLGNTTLIREEIYNMNSLGWLETLWQDLRYGVRMLAKSPGFTAVAVLTLALGIGATTAIFSVVDAVMIRPLPFHDAEQLVALWAKDSHYDQMSVSGPDYLDWVKGSDAFSALAAGAIDDPTVTGYGDPEHLYGIQVTPNFFQVLGVQPSIGRAFFPGENQVARGKVVILGYSTWQRKFGGDPSIVGKDIMLDGEAYAVIGIMPGTFRFPQVWGITDPYVYLPFTSSRLDQHRENRWIWVMGRMKPGVSLAQVRAQMSTIARRLAQQYPETDKGTDVNVMPLKEEVEQGRGPMLLLLLAAVGMMLLIACANVASMQLARTTARQREVAVRLTMGASRWRVVRQLLTESVLLALAAAAVGVLIAAALKQVLVASSPQGMLPTTNPIALNSWVLGFSVILAVVSGILFGLAPAFQASRTSVQESLKEAARSSSGTSSRRLRASLVAAQVALTFVLSIGAGLAMRCLRNIANAPTGFESTHVITMNTSLPERKYPKPGQCGALEWEVLRRLEGLPGVRAAAFTNTLPLGSGSSGDIEVEGKPAEKGSGEAALLGQTTPGYFKVFDIPIILGRGFTEPDYGEGLRVTVVNQAFVRRYWPSENPLGKHFRVRGDSGDCWTVVGVSRDVAQEGPYRPVYPQAFFPDTPRTPMLVVRTVLSPESQTRAIEGQVWSVDRDLPIYEVATMDEVLKMALGGLRYPAHFLTSFALLAFVLAWGGIYALVAYTVSLRTHEIGIRTALGAKRLDVLKLVLREGMIPTAVGLILGTAGALLVVQGLKDVLLYGGIRPNDPSILIGVFLGLGCAALLASYLPARRATKVDPLVALRYE